MLGYQDESAYIFCHGLGRQLQNVWFMVVPQYSIKKMEKEIEKGVNPKTG